VAETMVWNEAKTIAKSRLHSNRPNRILPLSDIWSLIKAVRKVEFDSYTLDVSDLFVEESLSGYLVMIRACP
jgi:hypothetical protein